MLIKIENRHAELW